MTSTYCLIKLLFIIPMAFLFNIHPFCVFVKKFHIAKHMKKSIFKANMIAIASGGYNFTISSDVGVHGTCKTCNMHCIIHPSAAASCCLPNIRSEMHYIKHYWSVMAAWWSGLSKVQLLSFTVLQDTVYQSFWNDIIEHCLHVHGLGCVGVPSLTHSHEYEYK